MIYPLLKDKEESNTTLIENCVTGDTISKRYQYLGRKGTNMKQIIILSSAVAAFTTAAFFLFQHSRKKERHLPIMTFNDLYHDNCLDDTLAQINE